MSSFDIEYDGEAAIGGASGTLNVLLVYEDFSTGLRAREAFEKVTCQLKLGADFKVNLWRLDLWHEPALLEGAATEAAKADIVFLSAHGQGELPRMANLWLEQWFERKRGEPCALVVLLDTLAGDVAAAGQTWEALRATARAAGVDVFFQAAESLQTERQPAREESRAQPESQETLSVEDLHSVEWHPYRDWGINE